MQKLFITVMILISGVAGFLLSYYQHKKTAPVVIETFHSPALFVKQIEGDPDAGRKIFKEFCSVCHDKEPQIDLNAPKISDKNIWQGLGQLGMPILLKNTINGMGAMPARGGCFECSDEQLQETIQYMLNKSK